MPCYLLEKKGEYGEKELVVFIEKLTLVQKANIFIA